MAISDELTLLASTKASIKNSINAKGGNITDSTPFADYASVITNLPSGDNSTLINLIERDITSINIPSGTTRIGNSVFSNCKSLTSVTIPNSVTEIDNFAFNNCNNLNNVTLPPTLTSINYSTFAYCQSFTSITIPNTVTSIGQSAFNGCNHLNVINIPDSVTTIGDSAFSYCSGALKLTIGSGVTSIGQQGFIGCNSLQSIICKPTTPPTLGGTANYNYPFNNTGYGPIYVPSASVAAYKAASGWSTYASRIVGIEDAVRLTPTNGDPAISVKNYELATAGYVQSTDVPSTIKNGAGSLEVCEGVTRIGMASFRSGTSLTSVTLPSTLTRMDEVVFMDCTSLTSVTVNATTPPTMYYGAFDNTNNCPIYVPAASVDTYKAANGWSTYASRIEAIPSE